MKTLTLKIPPQMDHALAAASVQANVTKSELVRRAVTAYLGRAAAAPGPPSALELAGDLVGCFEGGPADLASNPRHLDGFGRS